MPVEGRGRHLDPKQIPTRDRGIHLVEFKFCSDINPQQTLEIAHIQHQPLIQRLRTRSLRGISWNNSHTSCYTPWSRGHNLHSVHHYSSTKLGHPHAQSAQLATKIHCHAINSITRSQKQDTKYTLTTTTVIMGDLGGGLLVERLASGGLGAGRIAWLTTRRILISSLCCFSYSMFGG